MKRLLLTACVATAWFVVGSGTANGQVPDRDSVIGDPCWGGSLGRCVNLDASSGPQGENPSGLVDVSARQNFAGGPVTCLTVTGNRATVGFAEVFRTGDGLDGGFLFIEDNGLTGAGPDNVVFDLVADAPSVCPVNTVVYEPEDSVVSGDVVVHDAQPLPTARDQCKNGGWRNFLGFKNQGDCVSFVATGGRNQPATS